MVLKRIGVTGATGMLGRHLSAALTAAGAEIVAVSRPSSATGSGGGWDLECWLPDDELDALFTGVQAVIHAAAVVHSDESVGEARLFDANVRATANLGLWAARREVPIVFVSSASVYADPFAERLREDSPLGWSGTGGFYALTKLLAEDALSRLTAQGLKHAVVRPSSLYGFGLPQSKMLPSFLATARQGGAITLHPPVDDRVDMVHAADVSLAIIEIIRADAWETFNVASGRPVSIRELADACVAAAGRGNVTVDSSTPADREPKTRFNLDIARAQTRLGWRAKHDIADGLGLMLREQTR